MVNDYREKTVNEQQAQILADFEALDEDRRRELMDEADRLLAEQQKAARA